MRRQAESTGGRTRRMLSVRHLQEEEEGATVVMVDVAAAVAAQILFKTEDTGTVTAAAAAGEATVAAMEDVDSKALVSNLLAITAVQVSCEFYF